MEQSGLHRRITWVANLFVLNAAWLLACIPIITFFPSTAALFGVVREMQRSDDVSVLSAFIDHFKQTFWQSLVIGVLWAFAIATILLNFQVIGSADSALSAILVAMNAFALALLAFTTIFFFPVLVHYDLRWLGLLKYAFILGIGRLPTTLLCLLILSIVVIATLQLPLVIMLAGSLTAYAVYFLCSRSFPPAVAEEV